MKIVKESNTYDKREIIDYVIKSITNDDRYFNISCAYNSDVSTKDSVSNVKSKISDFVDDYIINELDGDYEFEDQVDEIMDSESSELKDIDDYFEYFGDLQSKQWSEEKDDQEREYRRSQGF